MPGPGEELERRIRERAYFLWLAAGRPEGRDAEHWQRACEEEALATPEHQARERRLDAEGKASFPASDPPSHAGITRVGRGDPR